MKTVSLYNHPINHDAILASDSGKGFAGYSDIKRNLEPKIHKKRED